MPDAHITYNALTALIVVDVQNDFADPAGALSVPGAELAVAAVNREIERALAGGALVAYTQDWHPERTPHFVTDGGPWPPHCVRDSWGAAFHPQLRTGAGPVVRKGTGGEDGYSGFSVRDPRTAAPQATELERLLRERGTRAVVVVGFATDYCVRDTALDAARLGFATTVVLDAVRAVDVRPGDGDAALAALRDASVTLV